MAIDTAAQTEKALVGALLTSQKKIVDVMDLIGAEDFSSINARQAFVEIVTAWKNQRPSDIISIAHVLPHLSIFLAHATNDAFAPAILEYAHHIAKNAKINRIMQGLNTIGGMKNEPAMMLEEMLSLYQKEMSAGKKNPAIESVINRMEILINANKRRGDLGFATGFDFLHDLYVRYVPGHIWTIGGFTSVGKTAVMIQKICNLISSPDNARIVVISTEMTEEQVVSRIISNVTGIDSFRILSGNFHDSDEEERCDHAKIMLSRASVLIYDDIYTLGDIEVAFRKASLQGGVNVGFIDYVQNCRVPEAKSQYQEQSELAKRLQKLGKDVSATMICLSQVSNDVGRGNTDQLELKGAGEWAAVSDIGIMLSRHKSEKHRLKYEVKKNRHGKLGEFELEYASNYTRLVKKSEW
jgi:replicative DNA helicase